jgi:hypothetical protein
MNERIQELAEQAYERKPVIVADPVTFEPIHKIGNYNEPMYHNVFNPEKFAELLIRECIDQCKKQEYEYWRAPEDQEFTPQDCADAIARHFGVEE